MARSLVLIGLAFAPAGCSQEQPTPMPTPADEWTTAAPRGPASPEPTNTPVPVPAGLPMPDGTVVGGMLPGALSGRWATSRDQCRRGAPMAITIEPTRIRFYESVAQITRVTKLADGTLAVDADVTGEGETQARSFDLKPSDGGKRLVRVEAKIPDIVYSRCPANGTDT